VPVISKPLFKLDDVLIIACYKSHYGVQHATAPPSRSTNYHGVILFSEVALRPVVNFKLSNLAADALAYLPSLLCSRLLLMQPDIVEWPHQSAVFEGRHGIAEIYEHTILPPHVVHFYHRVCGHRHLSSLALLDHFEKFIAYPVTVVSVGDIAELNQHVSGYCAITAESTPA
jgi:hypothetical protein